MNDTFWTNPVSVGVTLGVLGGVCRLFGWLVQRAVARHDCLVRDVETLHERVREMELEIELAFPDIKLYRQGRNISGGVRVRLHDS